MIGFGNILGMMDRLRDKTLELEKSNVSPRIKKSITGLRAEGALGKIELSGSSGIAASILR
jgi:hypothetical protein